MRKCTIRLVRLFLTIFICSAFICVNPDLLLAETKVNQKQESLQPGGKSGKAFQRSAGAGSLKALQSWQSFKTTEGSKWRVRWDKLTGYPRMIFGSETKRYGSEPASAGRSFLESNRSLFGLEQDGIEFELVRERETPMGTIVTFRQIYNGISVYNGVIDIIANSEGLIRHVTNSTVPKIQISTEPQMTVLELLSHIQVTVGQGKQISSGIETELVIYGKVAPKLAYRLISLEGENAEPWEYVVDANSGEVLRATRLTLNLSESGQTKITRMPVHYNPQPINTRAEKRITKSKVNTYQVDEPAPRSTRSASGMTSEKLSEEEIHDTGVKQDKKSDSIEDVRLLKMSKPKVVEYIIELKLESAVEVRTAIEAGVYAAESGSHQYEVPVKVAANLQKMGIPFTILGGVTEFQVLPADSGPESVTDSSEESPDGFSHGQSSDASEWDRFDEDEGPSVMVDTLDASGGCTMTSGTVNDFICDQCWIWRWVQLSDCAPGGSTTTNLEYRLRIDDEGDGSFYCGDYEIYLSSESSGGGAPTLLVYDNLGAVTDGGYDDDTDDDSDIYLNWRSTAYFNGEDPNQQWYVYIEDKYGGDDGQLNYIEFRVSWESTEYDFTAVDVFGANPSDIWTPISTFQEGDDVEICFEWVYDGPNPSPNTTIATQLNNGTLHTSSGTYSPGTWNTHYTWSNATIGTHRIRGWCDYYDDVSESNEGNNHRDETSAFVVSSGTDFAAQDVYGASPSDIWTPISTFQEGDNIEICFTWTYGGPDPSPNATMAMQLDNDPVSTSGGTFSPGTWNTHYTWSNATIGTHRIRGWCDYYDDVSESNEGNNHRDETSAFVVSSGTDFAAQDVYGASPSDIWTPISTFQEGDNIEICFTWTYGGPDPSPNATMAMQLDNDPVSTSGGTFSPGTWNTHYTWSNATIGTHRIRGWCDYNDDVGESNESNNYRDETSAFTVGSGSTQVFDPNPVNALNDTTLRDNNDADSAVPAGAYQEVTLAHLDAPVSGQFHLQGEFAVMENIELPAGNPPTSTTQNFHYTREPDGFEWVMSYHHITENQGYIQSVGFANVNNRAIHVDAHGLSGADNSHYAVSPPTWPFGEGYIAFGDGGVDDAEDADIILHEYGHSIQDNQSIGRYFGNGDVGFGNETGAMGEGFGDYWAASCTNDQSVASGFDPAIIGEWDIAPGGLRRVDGTKYYPDDMVDQVHADGEIWSACLWEMFAALGKEVADTLTLQSHFIVPADPTFEDGAMAILAVDEALYSGANAQTILTIFVNRGIFDIHLLSNDNPESFLDIPKNFSFQVAGNDWCGIAIYPTADHDIQADSSPDFSAPYENSEYAGTARDFIAVNGHDWGSSTHYAQVYYGSSSQYIIEAEWNANDLSLNAPEPDVINSGEVIKVYEVDLNAGEQYQVSLAINSGNADLSLFVFEPSRSSGSRSDNDGMADSSGAGGEESFSFSAGSAGKYAILVINENDGSADFILSVSESMCVGDYDGDNDVDGLDLAEYNANSMGIALADFANVFGSLNCQ